MKCSNCNKEVPENAKVCGYCGTQLKMIQTCPSCGEDVPISAKVCGFCGTRIAEISEAKPAAKRAQKKTEVPKKTVRKKEEKNVKPAKTAKVRPDGKKLPKWALPTGIAAVVVAVILFIVLRPGQGAETDMVEAPQQAPVQEEEVPTVVEEEEPIILTNYPSEIDSFVSGVKPVSHNDCKYLDPNYLYWENDVYIEDGSIIIDALDNNHDIYMGTNPFGAYGKALLYKIKIIPDPNQSGWNIFGIDAGIDDKYQGVFIGIHDTNKLANFTDYQEHEGSDYSTSLEIGNIDPNQWYYAFFAPFEDGDVYLRIWPQGDSENYADAEQQMQVPSETDSWSLIIHAFERGKFILDDYWIIEFDDIY